MQPISTLFVHSLRVAACTAVVIAAGCSSTQPRTTHHWVSQDKVAASVYRNDVASCAQTSETAGMRTPQATNTAEFRAYQKCMSERGYVLVAANDVGEPGRE